MNKREKLKIIRAARKMQSETAANASSGVDRSGRYTCRMLAICETNNPIGGFMRYEYEKVFTKEGDLAWLIDYNGKLSDPVPNKERKHIRATLLAMYETLVEAGDA